MRGVSGVDCAITVHIRVDEPWGFLSSSNSCGDKDALKPWRELSYTCTREGAKRQSFTNITSEFVDLRELTMEEYQW
ncbi:hypothetical protein TorRG33x02_010630 [Trema orientale]|uniref:Uncharacterized protein n=1 Tax=Trema orientale TaxID=63057 RepID=A0A2P5FYX8_TREOI|nr:hypothetical protein TorRG33x02_010630 [Trema orientale]